MATVEEAIHPRRSSLPIVVERFGGKASTDERSEEQLDDKDDNRGSNGVPGSRLQLGLRCRHCGEPADSWSEDGKLTGDPDGFDNPSRDNQIETERPG
eukprot:CAMPEP_0194043792 /NCGR_PEP_ID=MMETSP0009_2-20130614/15372_1 /TAXON_ID=210454 /ORGANISM="Grammatophora oceanica, Strain CCMP 410" /LENGTH=97 /DNA_ID=CAMNT_0038688129 /DNA_START=36 /DNA_END=329 /DNA_ORIENTATION=+